MFPELQNQSMICSILEQATTKEAILEFEQKLLAMPQIDPPPLKHEFADGLYIRTIYMDAAPEGSATFITGAIHKHDCYNILSQGRVLVSTEFGCDEITAPRQWVSPAGTKRALMIIEDAVWTTVHPNPEGITDIDEMVKYLTADTYKELDDYLRIQNFEVMP